jgi:hypothetical protein
MTILRAAPILLLAGLALGACQTAGRGEPPAATPAQAQVAPAPAAPAAAAPQTEGDNRVGGTGRAIVLISH